MNTNQNLDRPITREKFQRCLLRPAIVTPITYGRTYNAEEEMEWCGNFHKLRRMVAEHMELE